MNQSDPAPEKSRSLVSWGTPASNDRALVCIPWAGAGAAPFRPWTPVLGAVSTVYGLRLAGRESRRAEPPATTVAEVVDDVAAELADLGVPRVALFGQCSGAVLAFELAKALGRAGGDVQVTHLLVASQLPPPDVARLGPEAEHDLTQYVPADLRAEPDFVELLLPVIAADTSLMSGYVYQPDDPLTVPLTVLYGADDHQLSRPRLDGWRRETTGPTSFHEIAGADHLFGGAAWPKLAETVRDALT
ncbi:thioesterase II family protein [Micromonospora cathayae]|uniref:Thioesterase domain-containing protein n=1 Tax=Micromonospora cathayae TaxID=3028804 RepID=A0ABY7ZT67_9ACTN|nr:thioesterase domain-containing protein [Micromonospora sp. HUAS 3]WDZ86239.1 thioesterase domain-containing protein [Micromonospora sp. HUAS 3]